MPAGERAPAFDPAAWPGADEAARSRLFSPVRVGAVELHHRTWVPAMVPWRAGDDGLVTGELLDWYARLAEGRPGAIVVEATGIHDVPSGPLLRIGHERFLPGLRRLVETVRRHSEGKTRLFIQLIHFLRIRRRVDRDRFLREFLVIRAEHRRRLDMREARDEDVRARLQALSDAELRAALAEREWQDLTLGARERITDTDLPHIRALPATLPAQFVTAARHAREAGFDGVEIHAAHAYTLASFLSALNDRDDGYGKSRAGRTRLPVEVLRAIRSAVGRDYAVGIRFLADEAITGGHGIDDACAFAIAFAAAGADFLSLSRGGKFEDARPPAVGQAAYPYTGDSGLHCMPTLRRFGAAAHGLALPLARVVRAAIRAAGHETPVVAAGGLHTFRLAEEALERGDCDIVAAARQSLADPDWWEKMRTGRGASIRRCTLSNYCEGLDQKHKPVTCKLWDRAAIAAHEREALTGATHDVSGRRRLVAPR